MSCYPSTRRKSLTFVKAWPYFWSSSRVQLLSWTSLLSLHDPSIFPYLIASRDFIHLIFTSSHHVITILSSTWLPHVFTLMASMCLYPLPNALDPIPVLPEPFALPVPSHHFSLSVPLLKPFAPLTRSFLFPFHSEPFALLTRPLCPFPRSRVLFPFFVSKSLEPLLVVF